MSNFIFHTLAKMEIPTFQIVVHSGVQHCINYEFMTTGAVMTKNKESRLQNNNVFYHHFVKFNLQYTNWISFIFIVKVEKIVMMRFWISAISFQHILRKSWFWFYKRYIKGLNSVNWSKTNHFFVHFIPLLAPKTIKIQAPSHATLDCSIIQGVQAKIVSFPL